jgi:hypothetical protein
MEIRKRGKKQMKSRGLGFLRSLIKNDPHGSGWYHLSLSF